jgi:hypothetical protein
MNPEQLHLLWIALLIAFSATLLYSLGLFFGGAKYYPVFGQ